MKRKEVLEKAAECVCGQREQDYGSPEDNFQIIADLWNAYLSDAFLGNSIINSKDVAMMMTLLKIARAKADIPTTDTFVDIAGYAACAEEIINSKRPTFKK